MHALDRISPWFRRPSLGRPAAVLLAVACLCGAGWTQGPPPRPRPPPPAPTPAPAPEPPPPPAPEPSATTTPLALLPDAPKRLWVLGDAGRQWPLRISTLGVEVGSAEIGFRRIEFQGAPALELRTRRMGTQGNSRQVQEWVGVYRMDPALEPLLLSRTVIVQVEGGEPMTRRGRLGFDGRAIRGQGDGVPEELFRSQRPLVTDNSIYAFALLLEDRPGASLEVDYLVAAPHYQLVRAVLRAGPGRGARDSEQYLRQVELWLPAAEGRAEERVFQAFVDREHNFRAIELQPGGLLLQPPTPR